MKIKQSVCSLFLALGFSASLFFGAYGGVDSTAANSGFQFLDIAPSARNVALGSGGTALGENGFAYYNPAAPALDRKTNLNIGYAPMPFDFTIAHAQGSWSLDNMFFGANITNHFVDGIIPAGIQGTNPETQFSYDGSMASLNFGFIADNFGFGITLNGLEERIASFSAYGISVSAGMTYTVNKKINLGISALQLGATTGYDENSANLGQGYALPRSGRFGIAYSDSIFHMGITVTGDAVYRDVGVKGESLINRFNRLTVPIGIEFWPASFAAIRVGKRFNFDTELFTAGAGLSLSMLTLDIAVAVAKYVDDYEARPFIDLTYTLKKPAAVAPKNTVSGVPANRTIPTSKPAFDKPDSLKDTADSKSKIVKSDSLPVVHKTDSVGVKSGSVSPDTTKSIQPADSTAVEPKSAPKKR